MFALASIASRSTVRCGIHDGILRCASLYRRPGKRAASAATSQLASRYAVLRRAPPVTSAAHATLCVMGIGAASTGIILSMGTRVALAEGAYLKVSSPPVAEVAEKTCSSAPKCADDAAQKEGKANDETGKRSAYAQLIEIMRESKWFYVIAGLASVASSWFKSISASMLGSLFDVMGNGSSADYLAVLWRLGGAYFAQAGCAYAASVALAIATTRLGQELRTRFFASLLGQDIDFFDETSTGELAHQLSHDVGSLQTSVRTLFSKGVESGASLLTCSYFLWCSSPKLAVSILGLLPILSIGANGVTYLLRNLSVQAREASNHATGIASEVLASVRTVRAFTSEAREEKRYANALDEASNLKIRIALAAGGFYALLGLGINLITLFVGYAAGNELSKGEIAGAFTQVMLLERAIARLSMVGTNVAKAVQGAEHIFDIIDRRAIVNAVGLGARPPILGDIEVRNVSFTYPSRPDALVLDDLTLRFPKGKVAALVGPSGSGKTTVISLIERFYDVDKGEILIDGEDVRDIEPLWLRKHVGVVSQE